jgi:hypothetical protein
MIRGRRVDVNTILSQIDIGGIALPEFQRGYVWNRDQVRGLMQSMYKKHPVGSLLVWATRTEEAHARGDSSLQPGVVKLLLDGQQRITTLYGIIKGSPPAFFEGHAQAFTGLYFNLDTEDFEFYGPIKMKDDSLWINVTELMRDGVGESIQSLLKLPDIQPKLNTYINRLNSIESIKNIDLHIEEVSGEDKDIDVVVDIFNKVNSGGTKLSKGDLALAKVCADWPDARQEMRSRLNKWKDAGFQFKLDWLLRCINTIVTGEALFTALEKVDAATIRHGLKQAEDSIDSALDLISGRLGLDHNRVLGSPSSLPLIVRYMFQRGGHIEDYQERDKLLYWYIHTFLWGRYSASTEGVLNQDLASIEEVDGALDRLIDRLRQNRGDLRLSPRDFGGWSRSARFYPLLYMLTRVHRARDWDTGVELTNNMLGRLSSLQIHHIFPKSLLYKAGYARPEVNAIANFTFLTQETNLKVSNRDPLEYFEEFAQRQPGTVESHWIPMDRELWKIENYPDFLAARRELLAKAANEFLDSLLAGSVPEVMPIGSVLERTGDVLGGIVSEEEEQTLLDINIWVINQGLPEGELSYELVGNDNDEPVAVLDLAWPDGLQEGYSQPVALIIDEDAQVGQLADHAGFLFFTDPIAFQKYVSRDILAIYDAAD